MHDQSTYWQEWQQTFAGWVEFSHPAELHGLVTGVVCVLQPPGQDGWQALLAGLDVAGPAEGSDDPVWRLLVDEGQDLAEALDEDNLDFEPLLPDDEQPLPERVQALAAWCSGLLLGFALAGGQVRSDEQELIADLQELSALDWEVQDSDEASENDYADLLEFVRLVPVSLSMGRTKAGQLPGPGKATARTRKALPLTVDASAAKPS